MNMDDRKATTSAGSGPRWSDLKQLLTNRMLLGIYIGQYCITALTYFFIAWFPIYLVKGRGLSILQVGFVATIPAICGFAGGILSGMLSDYLIKRGRSVTLARKTPFVIGMGLAAAVVACNYVDSPTAVVAIMALAFFGKEGLGGDRLGRDLGCFPKAHHWPDRGRVQRHRQHRRDRDPDRVRLLGTHPLASGVPGRGTLAGGSELPRPSPHPIAQASTSGTPLHSGPTRTSAARRRKCVAFCMQQ